MLTKLALTLIIPQLMILTPSHLAVKGARIENVPGLTKSNARAIEPIISVPSAVVIDAETGQILYKKNHDQLRPIASITKLMTAALYRSYHPEPFDDIITLLPQDETNAGRRWIYRKEQARAEDLLNLMLVGSENNAARALARVGGFLPTFSKDAREITRTLGLSKTTFVDPTGLNENNQSTTHEIALLAREVFSNNTLAKMSTQEEYRFNPLYSRRFRQVPSTNELLGTKLFTITGGKTGHTQAAGYCLVIRATNTEGEEIITVVLGAETSEARFQDAKALSWWVFENFE